MWYWCSTGVDRRRRRDNRTRTGERDKCKKGKKKGIKEIEVKRADDTRLRKQSDGVRKRREVVAEEIR